MLRRLFTCCSAVFKLVVEREREREREREMFYLTTHSTHFIYGYMASDIWLRTILIVRKETRCRHIGYSFRLTARVLLYAPSHRQDNTYHGLCYTSRGALAGTRNSSMGNWLWNTETCSEINFQMLQKTAKQNGHNCFIGGGGKMKMGEENILENNY